MKIDGKSCNDYVIIGLFLTALLYFLFFSKFDIMPGDEGYFNLACLRIIKGEAPYRDFFLHTPPFSYYVQAFIFKILGMNFIVGRITTVLIGILILIFLFFISLRISVFPFSLVPGILFIFWGVSHIPYPSFNWYGLLVALAIISAVFKFIDTDSKAYMGLAGVLTAILFFTKQNLGIAAVVSISIFITLHRFCYYNKSQALKNIFSDYIFFAVGVFLTFIVIFVYFYIKNALSNMFYYLIDFSIKSSFMRMDIFPFPHLKIVSFIILGIYLLLGYFIYIVNKKKRYALFIVSLFIIVGLISTFYNYTSKDVLYYVNDHIKEGFLNGFFNLPTLFIVISIFLLWRKIFKKETLEKNDACVLFLSMFSFFFIWFALIISRDMIHLIPSMPIAYPFFGYFLYRVSTIFDEKLAPYKVLKYYFFVVPIAFFSLFGFFINVENETFRFSSAKIKNMDYHMSLDKAKYLIVERERGNNLERLITYIDDNTLPEEKIFVFYLDASIYILSDRMPATFNTLFIPNAFMPMDQKRVIADLIKNDIKLIVCDDKILNCETKDGSRDFTLTAEIENYIHRYYAVREKIGPYYILGKNI